MTRAIVPGATDSNYTYDPLGRRVVKTIATSAAPLWGSATWNAFTWTARRRPAPPISMPAAARSPNMTARERWSAASSPDRPSTNLSRW